MKKYIIFPILVVSMLAFSACELDLTNPNAATENEVYGTKDGLFALSVGIQQLYSVSALEPVLLTPSVTTRETAIMTTFANLEELETGGPSLSGDNGYTVRLFSRLMRIKGMAENLIEAVPQVTLEAGTASGLTAWGHLFRAMTLGNLAHNFEQVALENSLDNQAVFSGREAAYAEAITLLEQGIALLNSTPASAEFKSVVSPDIDLKNTMLAMLARYQLMSGSYAAAASTAAQVDMQSTSVFRYDQQNANPVWAGMFSGTVSYAPRADFGLPASLVVDPEDQRIGFYMELAGGSSLNNLPVGTMVCPFFNSRTSSIPVYRPGEMLAIQAEANARLNNLSAAEDFLNQLRQKTPESDPFGIGAGLTSTYTANGDQQALLNEIYKHRRLELFLSGTSLDDSRRFNRPEPPTTVNLDSERNRNFYPYPETERLNNPNTPPNPGI